ncbi:uncharacterized protein [Patagioenas fasciata]|uniref:uncharacterized protein n=1 Tax=Patagioenas fasciata TaxID=372321 RepID=UPI003A993BDE
MAAPGRLCWGGVCRVCWAAQRGQGWAWGPCAPPAPLPAGLGRESPPSEGSGRGHREGRCGAGRCGRRARVPWWLLLLPSRPTAALAEAAGPCWAAPRGSRQLGGKHRVVRDVSLQQHQGEDDDLQQGEEQQESPGGRREGSGRAGGKLLSALNALGAQARAPHCPGKSPGTPSPSSTHLSPEVLRCHLDASCSSYRPRHSRDTCWAVPGGRGLGAQSPPASPLTPAPHSVFLGTVQPLPCPRPQPGCLSYQSHGHQLLEQRRLRIASLRHLPPATDTTRFRAVRRDLGQCDNLLLGQQGARVLPSLCWGWLQAPPASQRRTDPAHPSCPWLGGHAAQPASCSQMCRAAAGTPECLRGV